MVRHAASGVALVTLTLIATLLPFLPGSHDPVAAPLSMTARVFGFAGLVLLPFGIVWAARPRRGSAVAGLAAFCVVWALVTLAAFAAAGFVLAGVMVLIGGRLFARLRSGARTAERIPGCYLAAVPPVVFVLQLTLVPRAVEFSRDRVIRNAAPLIADIEAYRAARGAYPPSLLAAWPDYQPGVIGVERYQYEPSGAAYNLVFEQIARDLPTREFVVYNPRDEQVFTSHPMDILQYSPARLERARGFFAVYETAHPHWKYFWFD